MRIQSRTCMFVCVCVFCPSLSNIETYPNTLPYPTHRFIQCSLPMPGRRLRAQQPYAMSTSAAGVDCYPYGLRSLSVAHNPGGTMEATLRRLGRFEVVPPPGPSKFVQPETVLYDLDGAGLFALIPALGYGHEAGVCAAYRTPAKLLVLCGMNQASSGAGTLVRTHPSVGIAVYHLGLRAALIVRQFRPAVRCTILAACFPWALTAAVRI